MRVLHVSETAKGGIGTYLDLIIPLQTASLGRKSVKLIIPEDHADQFNAITDAQLLSYPRAGRSIRSLLSFKRCIAESVAAFRPDVIHAHSSFAGALIRLMYGWRLTRPVIIYCPHGWAFNMQIAPWKQRVTMLVETLLSRLCDRIIAVSHFEANEAIRIGIKAGRVRMVHNGIPPRGPAPAAAEWHDTRRKILFIGRLDKQKGFDLLLAAVAGLETQVTVTLAGAAVVSTSSGPVSQVPEHVAFLGWLKPAEIEGHLLQADLVVMPSRWEGFGLVALEAMRAGKPVIATRVGGIPEIVEDGVTGRLVPEGNVAALRAALLQDDLVRLKQMGAAGLKRFNRYFQLEQTHYGLMREYYELTAAPAYQRRMVRRVTGYSR